jgi:hypothetical protein
MAGPCRAGGWLNCQPAAPAAAVLLSELARCPPCLSDCWLPALHLGGMGCRVWVGGSVCVAGWGWGWGWGGSCAGAARQLAILLGRPAGMQVGVMRLREFKGAVAVGQQLPMLRVPTPNSRDLK